MAYIWIGGLLSLVVLVVWLGRPKNLGGAYTPYFKRLNDSLKQQGVASPRLVLDLDRLDHNISWFKERVGSSSESTHLRLVVKSLPSWKLLSYLSERLEVSRYMVFHVDHLPKLLNEARRESEPHLVARNVQILLGKPWPVAAVAGLYRAYPQLSPALDQVVWLIDTCERAVQYTELAKTLNRRFRCAFEIEVGLGRGGFACDFESEKTRSEWQELIRVIDESEGHLRFSGLMGYDAHIAKAPFTNAHKWSSHQRSQHQYNEAISYLKRTCPTWFIKHGVQPRDQHKNKNIDHEHLSHQHHHDDDPFIFNGAGSMSVTYHNHNTFINDVSVGSLFLKPFDFHLPSLEGVLPAVFIATPVLKKWSGIKIPFIGKFNHLLSLWNPNHQTSHFIYGGFWKAVPHQPPGMFYHGIYGRSSNQELLVSSRRTGLNVDDFVFLQPTQSEAVLKEFGALLVVRDGNIVDEWDVF